ncbi:hypothetical protein GCM10007890_15940 [Methylobacterium tardum]|uniref:Uncharacterized protein n=1 Tax=Methylobacterium tardum TaxID=374432 RepID=A0AA37WQU2_9HYPH|nr:hypothetical protein GCM10007890_15940 [Methylobacterium tardum]
MQAARRGIALRQLDLAFVDMVDRPDMNPIRADHLGMFLDLRSIGHQDPPGFSKTIEPVRTRSERSRRRDDLRGDADCPAGPGRTVEAAI